MDLTNNSRSFILNQIISELDYVDNLLDLIQQDLDNIMMNIQNERIRNNNQVYINDDENINKRGPIQADN